MLAEVTAPLVAIVDAKQLRYAVDTVLHTINKHTTVPILSMVKLTIASNKLSVLATDLENTTSVDLDVDATADFSTTVDGRSLKDALPASGTISLESLGNVGYGLKLTSDGSTQTFVTLPASEYPIFPNLGEFHGTVESTLGDLQAALTFANSASKEECRGAALMSTLLQLHGSTGSVINTDGYQLSTTPIAGSSTAALFDVILNAGFVDAIRKFKGDKDACASIQIYGDQKNQAVFVCGGTMIVGRNVDGQYPNWQQVIPAQFDRKFILDTDTLIKLVKAAGAVSADRANMIILDFDGRDSNLTIRSQSYLKGHYEASMQANSYYADPIKIAFNAKYLGDLLTQQKKRKSKEIVMEMLSPISPAKISGDESSYSILMPLRQ